MTGMTAPVVDFHCHLFNQVSRVGIDLAAVPPVARAEVMLDAGSTGPVAFGKFAEQARKARANGIADVYGLVNVAEMGLDKAPEITSREEFQPERAAEEALRHPDVARGLKVRAIQPAIALLGLELIERTVKAAGDAGLPVMVHFGQQDGHFDESEMLTPEILQRLRPGDVASHVFTGQSGGVFASDRNFEAARQARARGVLFDIGHGGFNFDISVARRGYLRDFAPDFVSSDVTTGTLSWLSLPYALSAVASAGFDSGLVVAAATTNPARWLGLEGRVAERRIEIGPGEGRQKDSFGVKYRRSHNFTIAAAH